MSPFRPTAAVMFLALGACGSQDLGTDSSQACTISAAGPYAQTNSCDLKATATYFPASGQSVFVVGYGNDIYDGVTVVVRFAGLPTVASYSNNVPGVQGGVTAAHNMAGENILWRALAGGGLNSGGFGFTFSRVDIEMQSSDSVRYVVHGDLSSTLETYTQKQAAETVTARF